MRPPPPPNGRQHPCSPASLLSPSAHTGAIHFEIAMLIHLVRTRLSCRPQALVPFLTLLARAFLQDQRVPTPQVHSVGRSRASAHAGPQSAPPRCKPRRSPRLSPRRRRSPTPPRSSRDGLPVGVPTSSHRSPPHRPLDTLRACPAILDLPVALVDHARFANASSTVGPSAWSMCSSTSTVPVSTRLSFSSIPSASFVLASTTSSEH
mmetsp:Transcript_132677/g.424634  ORF Transcript_132677/g.424634 Transcript_132677/m.424634 type:complete len:207 (+) Transcript_132677:277-897(+)